MENLYKIAEKNGLNIIPELQTDDSCLFVGKFADAEKYQDYFSEMTLPRHHSIRVYGKVCYPGRYTQFFGYTDKVHGYRFSGSTAVSVPMEKELIQLTDTINEMFDDEFNGALVNRYITEKGKTGHADSIGRHADNEGNLGKHGVIGIVYGVTKFIRFSDKTTGKKIVDVDVPDGSVYWMAGKFQDRFCHEITKQKRVLGTRLSITFRNHKEI
jgi:alkylated DNA repair dioxygenase AlkB